MKLINTPLLACAFCLIAGSASAVVTEFSFINGMTGANESTPNASAGSVIINTLQYDDAVGSFGTFTVDLSFSDLTTNATASHIHGYAAEGVNAGVLQALTADTSTTGSITGSWTLPDATAVTNLFSDLTYINLHSTTFGGGELRGQLTAVAAVPEAETYALFLGAFSLCFILIRKKRF